MGSERGEQKIPPPRGEAGGKGRVYGLVFRQAGVVHIFAAKGVAGILTVQNLLRLIPSNCFTAIDILSIGSHLGGVASGREYTSAIAGVAAPVAISNFGALITACHAACKTAMTRDIAARVVAGGEFAVYSVGPYYTTGCPRARARNRTVYMVAGDDFSVITAYHAAGAGAGDAAVLHPAACDAVGKGVLARQPASDIALNRDVGNMTVVDVGTGIDADQTASRLRASAADTSSAKSRLNRMVLPPLTDQRFVIVCL